MQSEGGKRGVNEHRKRWQMQAHGAGRRDERRRMVGVVNVQVDDIKYWEKRWGAGVTDICYDNEWILMGGKVGWRRQSRHIQKRLRQVQREGI